MNLVLNGVAQLRCGGFEAKQFGNGGWDFPGSRTVAQINHCEYRGLQLQPRNHLGFAQFSGCDVFPIPNLNRGTRYEQESIGTIAFASRNKRADTSVYGSLNP